MDISILGLWFVCGLGTAIFAAVAPMSRRSAIVCGAAFILGAWLGRSPFAPLPAAVAMVAALAAAAHLVRLPRPIYAITLAGLLGGLWTGVLQLQGLPPLAAAVAAAAVLSLSAFLRARRSAYASALLRDEALLFMVVLGVFVAAAPGVLDGWHAAANLNLQVREPVAATVAIPLWALTAATVALVSGGLFSLWSRR